MVDWGRVNELREEIGIEDFQEVLTLFLDEADEAMGRLWQTSDSAEIEADLHFLKGSALNLGLEELASICQAGERSAAQGHADVPISAVADCYAKSRQMLEQGIKTPNAA